MIKNGEILNEVFRLYSERKRNAEHLAFEINQRVMQDEQYSNLCYAIRNLNLDIAKAEYECQYSLSEHLCAKRDFLRQQRTQALQALGFSEEQLKPIYTCPKCKDTGYVEGGGICECFYHTLAEVSQRILDLKEPILPSFAQFKAQNSKQEKLKAKFMEYCDKFPPEKIKNLIFSGATGTGKTFTAGAIASELKQKNFSVIYLSATKLNEIFRIYHITDDQNKRAIFDLICDCDLLVIDDLGTEPIYKNVTVVYLTAFISERLTNQKPFIITTNLSLEEIKTRYNERLFSRLSEDNTLRVNFDGEDLRLKK